MLYCMRKIGKDVCKMKFIHTHKISKYLHGTFAEFFGSTTYDGIWVGRDSNIPNVNGIRLDVIEGIRDCGLTVFRWPGGCCAEKYHWQDGVGTDRKPRMHFIKDKNNGIWDMSFGTDEFIELCRLCDVEPMLVANVATGTPEEFRAWFEYCNGPAVTKYGSQRAANGHPEPYNVRLWGIGNTDENAWKMAYEPHIYARDYLRFVTALDGNFNASADKKEADKCTLVGLGFSIRHGHHDWPAKVMDLVTCNGEFKGPDMLSVHHYLGSMKDKKCGPDVEYTDQEYYYLIDALREYEKDIEFHRQLIRDHAYQGAPTYLAIDEWGAWHAEDTVETGRHSRQTMRDAIFGAIALHIFYRNCDVVKMANQTQLCNLNQSLFDTDGKHFVRTATYWVMKLFKEHMEQYLLEGAFEADSSVDALASISEQGDRVVITAANKHLHSSEKLTLCSELSHMSVTSADIIYADDVRAYNTYDAPYNICAKHFDGVDFPTVTLPPHSVIRLVFEKK
ncbi:MAG: hypothetical protein E7642_03200 [Ruminococcaceae bacterium]|nr:hypothetical protein [Oscillospiraceae bacterium]